jgi:hypothetical protein
LPSAAQVAHVLDKLGQNIEKGLNTWQLRTLSAVRRCRTAALDIDGCDTCGNISISYNSCRNRHCPKCQGKTEKIGYKLDKANFYQYPIFMWFLPCPIINVLAMQDPRLVYDLLLSRLGNFEKFWAKEIKLG